MGGNADTNSRNGNNYFGLSGDVAGEYGVMIFKVLEESSYTRSRLESRASWAENLSPQAVVPVTPS